MTPEEDCKHEWVTKPYAYNFLVCEKCGAWLAEDGVSILHHKKDKDAT